MYQTVKNKFNFFVQAIHDELQSQRITFYAGVIEVEGAKRRFIYTYIYMDVVSFCLDLYSRAVEQIDNNR